MYDDNEKKINWLYILKRLVILVIALIIIFGVISLATRCSKKDDSKQIINPEPVSLKAQIDKMQDATIKYLTKDSMPTTINSTKNIKLKYLVNKNLIETLKDNDGTVCDEDASYSEITRLENNYALKTTLTCGKKTEYKVIYIGCFNDCKDGDICKTTNSKVNGICGEKKNNNSKTTTTTKKTNNNNSSNKNNDKTTTTTKKASGKVEYQYKKELYKVCTYGVANKEGKCVVTNNYTLAGNVVSYDKVVETTKDAIKETVSYSNPGKATNTDKVHYEIVKYDKTTGKYIYNKYTCAEGTLNGKTCVVKSTVKVNGCEDKTYTYNSKSNTCTKEVKYNTVTDPTIVYDYTWSTNKNLGNGWVKTGKVR